MNAVQIHLALNHVAILGTIFSLVILLSGFVFSQKVLLKTAMVGFVFSAIVAIPVYFSGEDAEHEVEHLQGIEEFRIEAHEESAGLSFALILVSGIVAAAGLYFREKYSRLIMFALIIVSLAASASLTYTGFLGGKIRHSELSKDTLKGDVLHEHVHD